MKKSAIAIGTFDGVHLGHQRVIQTLRDTARRRGLKSILMTVESPMRAVAGCLTSTKEKLAMLRTQRIDEIIVIPNTTETTHITREEFYEEVLCRQLNAATIIVGTDFTFGHSRLGTVSWLRSQQKHTGVSVTIVPKRMYRRKPISSSRIRVLVKNAQIDYANTLLGKMCQMEGVPESGRGVGRTLGFPTVNIRPDVHKLLPMGVFAGYVECGGKVHPAAINVGLRPSLKSDTRPLVEVHVLSPLKRWPAKKTRVYLAHHIRAERVFSSLTALSVQIGRDVKRIKKVLKIEE